MKPLINAERVREIVTDCLFDAEEIQTLGHDALMTVAVIAEGITATFGFHPERLKGHEAEVVEMLKNLPEAFMADGDDGGWSCLKATVDKNNMLWGQHKDVEILLVLGLALGKVTYCLPRKLWGALPGGMPYISITV